MMGVISLRIFGSRQKTFHYMLISIALLFLLIPIEDVEGTVGIFKRLRELFRPRELRSCNFLLEFEDYHLKVPDIAIKYNLPLETHTLTSKDGYIQDIHRIPAPGKPPVYLVSGFFLSSRDFLLNCDRRAAAMRLHDEGFDVWLSNVRGNAYAREHVNLTSRDGAFWDFGVDEIAKYDTPLAIDHILNTTGFSKLNWVGYSMGNAIVLGLLSEQPEYNSKINLGFAMGGAAVLTHTRVPFIRFAAPHHVMLEKFFKRFAHGEVMPEGINKFFNRIGPYICGREGRTQRVGFCALNLGLQDGPDPLQVDPRVLAAWFGAFPNAVPVRGLAQWLQWVRSGTISKYDYGREGNLRNYNQALPPPYDLKKVQSPIVYFYAENDYFVTPEDVNSTIPLLPSIQKVIRIKSPAWNHIDYILGRDADIHVYNEIIYSLKESYNATK